MGLTLQYLPQTLAGRIVRSGAEIHWYEAHGIPKRFKNKEVYTMSDFVICIDNKSNPASINVGEKVPHFGR